MDRSIDRATYSIAIALFRNNSSRATWAGGNKVREYCNQSTQNLVREHEQIPLLAHTILSLQTLILEPRNPFPPSELGTIHCPFFAIISTNRSECVHF